MFTGPDIVTDGLVLALDAANVKSYPGTGTTWFDRSGNGYNGTLTNGPTFDSGNGGSIMFDGVDDYVQFITTLNGLTMSIWFKTSTSNEKVFVGGVGINGNGSLQMRAGKIGIATGNNGIQTIRNDFWDGIWHNLVVLQIGEGYPNDYKIYVDGIEESIEIGGPYRYTIGGYVLGASYYQSNFRLFWDGHLGPYLSYNRLLSSQEILQNYNATKSRFSL